MIEKRALCAGFACCCLVLAACADSEPNTDAGETAREDTEGEPDAQASDASQEPARGGSVPKAALRRVEMRPIHEVPDACEVPDDCQDGRAVQGRLDENSLAAGNDQVRFLLDAYVVTAKRTGTLFIASSVQAIGDSYEYGYGYPLSVQAVDSSEGLPKLTSKLPLVITTDTYDNALDDGKASIGFDAQAGTQYIVIYKGLVGVQPPERTRWNYSLSFCGSDMTVPGIFFVESDELVSPEPLSAPLSEESPAGAVGQMIGAFEVTP